MTTTHSKTARSQMADDYRLKSVRGERLDLPPHPKSCELSALPDHVYSVTGPVAVDLFSGAGGLSLGLEEAGFNVVLGVDRSPHAVSTHRAHFAGASVRADLHEQSEIDRVTEPLEGIQVDLVAGGPPCQPFSRAGRNKVRSLKKLGAWEGDRRHELWQAFVAVVERLGPRAVLMENVPDLATGRHAEILARLVEEIEGLGYQVHLDVLTAAQHGVPQHRQRLFLVGLQPRSTFEWPSRTQVDAVLEDAISDLPPVEAGDREDSREYMAAPTTMLQQWCRAQLPGEERSVIRDHYTRAVRQDDLEAFRLMSSSTLYSELPEAYRRYRDDIFTDKYKRLAWKQPSRTITAHLARDGYWYIHPEQHRTLTVREAARIQTFPDWFRFGGHFTNAYHQIGEAVPPLLGLALGKAIRQALDSPASSRRSPSTLAISSTLTAWIESRDAAQLAAPWRSSGDLWSVLLGMLLFEKKRTRVIETYWPYLHGRWPTAADFLADERAAAGVRTIEPRSPETTYELLQAIAGRIAAEESDTVSLEGVDKLREFIREAAYALAGRSGNRPVPAGLLRVAERVLGTDAERSRLIAQILLVRLAGYDPQGHAYGAALEVADRFCVPQTPNCGDCPLSSVCVYAREQSAASAALL